MSGLLLWEHDLNWDIYYSHTHLTVIKLGPPTVGMEMVEVRKMDLVLSWLDGLAQRFVSVITGSFAPDSLQKGAR